MSYYMKYINVWWIVQFLTLALLGCRHVGELVAGVFFLVCIVGSIWGNAKVKLLSAMGLFMFSGGIAVEKSPCIFISAKEKTNIPKLKSDIYKMVAEIHAGRYPFNNFLW